MENDASDYNKEKHAERNFQERPTCLKKYFTLEGSNDLCPTNIRRLPNFWSISHQSQEISEGKSPEPAVFAASLLEIRISLRSS
jgi:hypothetical protein